ncbi:MAG: murein biosynthesis integral membrane protein MurJ [Candidatus Omnitrophica bacterium]|nr:murein biosynthesis integral membrane protein MurJ [Candidatus Omnitrophota bacterium]
MFKKIIKNTSILSLGTLISRVLGLVRLVLISNFFGTGAILEAFIVAFRLPNLFRSVFGEGFGDAVAVPVLSEYQDDKEELFKIGNHLISLFTVVLLITSLLGMIFGKYLVSLIAPGFIADGEKFALAVSFTRITFFYLFFIGLAVNFTSILYSLKKFFIPAINPVFLNISFIIGIIFFADSLRKYILVICVLVGGILQIVFPFVALRRSGFIFKFRIKECFKDKVILRMVKLFLPRVWSSVIYHLSVIVDTVFSSLSVIVGVGALAAITYANVLIQLPLALIVLPLTRVAIVDLSLYHKQSKMDDFKKLFVFSFQNIVFFVVPITFVFLFLSEGIIDVLFKRGEFDAHSLAITSSVFFFYSFGLFFFCMTKLFVSAFYALKNTAIPAKLAALSLVVNVILSAALMFHLRIGGVALASSLAAVFNCFLLYKCLLKQIGAIDWQNTPAQFVKVVVISLMIGFFSKMLWGILPWNKYINMSAIFIIDVCLFFSSGMIFGLGQADYLKKWLLRACNCEAKT